MREELRNKAESDLVSKERLFHLALCEKIKKDAEETLGHLSALNSRLEETNKEINEKSVPSKKNEENLLETFSTSIETLKKELSEQSESQNQVYEGVCADIGKSFLKIKQEFQRKREKFQKERVRLHEEIKEMKRTLDNDIDVMNLKGVLISQRGLGQRKQKEIEYRRKAQEKLIKILEMTCKRVSQSIQKDLMLK